LKVARNRLGCGISYAKQGSRVWGLAATRSVFKGIMTTAERAGEMRIFSAKKAMAGVWELSPSPVCMAKNIRAASAISHASPVIRV
jgi:hypothetical protein